MEGKNKMKQRFKSYKFWVALSAALIIFIQALGKAFHFSIDPTVIDGIVMGFCGVLVVFGFVDKPENKEGEESDEEDNSKSEKKDVAQDKKDKNK